jgi:hypothetical protein
MRSELLGSITGRPAGFIRFFQIIRIASNVVSEQYWKLPANHELLDRRKVAYGYLGTENWIFFGRFILVSQIDYAIRIAGPAPGPAAAVEGFPSGLGYLWNGDGRI